MKPFDLGLANKGEKMITRNGKKVEEFHQFKTNELNYCCMALIDGDIYSYTTCGQFSNAIHPHSLDLMMASVKREAWINIYRGANRFERHGTRQEADACAQASRLDCIRIEWEE